MWGVTVSLSTEAAVSGLYRKETGLAEGAVALMAASCLEREDIVGVGWWAEMRWIVSRRGEFLE
jgi:hypothetical protein